MKNSNPRLSKFTARSTPPLRRVGTGAAADCVLADIKERRDYSCAGSTRPVASSRRVSYAGASRLNADGGGRALREVEIGPGDVVAVNDPFAVGARNLPDVTLVRQSWSRSQKSEVRSQQD